ncbi:MAG: transporter substrate-binding domain-containing protein [Alphaproteobacteria bacterium]|nr:transporter substrate-binding domain-containing protein [Alphaproteobacteria bacterium]
MRRRDFIRLASAAAVAALAGRVPQARADVLDAIKSRGKLLAGVKYDTPPFGFVDSSNEVAGFDVDLVREIAKKLGVPVEFVKVTSPTRIPLLISGNVDLVAASMTNTPERAQAIDFSITYYTGAQRLVVPESSTIAGTNDLKGKIVAVQQGTTLEKNLADVAPGATALPFRDYTSAWLALRQGRADALTGSSDVLRGFIKTTPGFKIVGEKFSIEPFGIGVRKGEAGLRTVIDTTLRELWKSGRYQELYRHWFEIDPDVPIEGAA